MVLRPKAWHGTKNCYHRFGIIIFILLYDLNYGDVRLKQLFDTAFLNKSKLNTPLDYVLSAVLRLSDAIDCCCK